MKLRRNHISLLLTGLSIIVITACDNQNQKTRDKSAKSTFSDSVNHGYNELANPDNRKSFTISDFNTDNSEIKNIDRPSKSTIATKLDTTLLFGIWTSDPNGPHADFELTSKSFYVVDYDGDGDMHYELMGNNMRIYYDDFIQEGQVISVGKDTLKIMWKDYDKMNNYVRWTQQH
jgi:hypothetical protein